MYNLKFALQTIPVFCHIEDFGCAAGGWTLVMKTDGTKVHSSFKLNDRLLMNPDFIFGALTGNEQFTLFE